MSKSPRTKKGAAVAASSEEPSGLSPAEQRRRDHDKAMDLCRRNVEAAKADKTGRVYRVYADGIFDMAHLGHFRMLEQAKNSLGDPKKVELVCGVCNDEDTIKWKGKVVMNHQLRTETMRHVKWCDEVRDDAPWVITPAYMEKNRIDFVAHDALPYVDLSGASADGDVYLPIKKAGKFLETQRTEGISTSDLIVTIVKEYDEYVARNLKRGYTKEALNGTVLAKLCGFFDFSVFKALFPFFFFLFSVGRTWEVRALAHQTEAKLKATKAEVGERFADLSADVKAFISDFTNPPAAGLIQAETEHARDIMYHSMQYV
jgi:choline-phosphate cytidylyltransferase